MKPSKFPALVLTAVLIAVPVSQFVWASPAPAPQDSGNIYKEIMDHKTIQWKTAPDASIPPDVCTMMQACAAPAKVAVLTLTEGGQKVIRGLFLSPTNTKGQDAMILYRQTPGDRYFFLVGPDGNLQKTAYVAIGGQSWVLMSNTLAQPTFAKDKAAWHAWVSKPAPAAAAAPKPGGRRAIKYQWSSVSSSAAEGRVADSIDSLRDMRQLDAAARVLLALFVLDRGAEAISRRASLFRDASEARAKGALANSYSAEIAAGSQLRSVWWAGSKAGPLSSAGFKADGALSRSEETRVSLLAYFPSLPPSRSSHKN